MDVELSPSVPLNGVSITAFEAAVHIAQSGRRVWRSGAAGFRAISKPFGNVPTLHTSDHITAVLSDDEDIGDGRMIAAAVWDNVRVLSGAEEGRVGKVTAFRAGARGDGTDDVYVVESILEAKFDARLLEHPNLGWDGTWPQSWLDAKSADKAWQKERDAPEFVWPSLSARAVRLELRASAFERYTEYLTTDDLCKLVVLPRTVATDGAASRSFCELLAARWHASSGVRGEPVARATHFVSHAWKYDARRVAATLREWSDRESDADLDRGAGEAQPHRFWFDSFVLDQHAAAAGKFTSAFWFHGFSNAIETMGHTLVILMPWRNAIPLPRAWCVYEIAETARAKAQTTFLLPPRERSGMLDSLSAADRIHQFAQLNEILAAVELESAEGGADDRAQIMALAEAHGMTRLNGRVCAALREWLLQCANVELARLDAAAEVTEIAAVDAVAALPSAAEAEAGTKIPIAGEAETAYVARNPIRDAADAFCKPLANMYQQLGLQDDAAPFFHRFSNLTRRRRGEPELLHTPIAQAAPWDEAQLSQSYAQALASMRDGLATMLSAPTVAPNSEAVLWVVEQIAMMLRRQGNVDEAVTELRRALRGSEETHGDLHVSHITLRRAALLADALAAKGDADGAALLSARVDGVSSLFCLLLFFVLFASILSFAHLFFVARLFVCARVDEAREAAQRTKEAALAAAAASAAVVEREERTSGRQPWLVRPVTMGDMLLRHGGLDETLAQLLASVGALQEHHIDVPCDLADSLYRCLLAAGRAADALPHVEAVHAARVAESGPRTTAALEARSELAYTCMRLGRIADAVAHAKAVHIGKRRTLGEENGATLQAANNAAALLLMVHVDEGVDKGREAGGGALSWRGDGSAAGARGADWAAATGEAELPEVPAMGGGGGGGAGRVGPVVEAAALLRVALNGASRAAHTGISTWTGMGIESGNDVTRAIAANLSLALSALPGAEREAERAAVEQQYGVVAVDGTPEWCGRQMTDACGAGEIVIQRAVR